MTISEGTRNQLTTAFDHMVAARLPGTALDEALDQKARRILCEVFEVDPDTVEMDNEALLAIGTLLTVAEHVAEHYEPTWDMLP